MNHRWPCFLSLMISIVIARCAVDGWSVSPVAAQGAVNRPIVLHELSQIGGPIVSASADGRVVYLVAGPRFVVLELSPSGALREVASLRQRWRGLVTSSLAVGPRVYVTTSWELLVFDVSDHAAPRLRSRQSIPGANQRVLDQRVDGHVFLVTAPDRESSDAPEAIAVDVTGAAPRVVGRTLIPGLPGAFSARPTWSIVDVGKPILVGSDGRLVELRMSSDGLAVRPLAALSVGGDLTRITTDGPMVYGLVDAPDSTTSIVGFDLSDPESPVLAWRSADMPPQTGALVARDGRLFVSLAPAEQRGKGMAPLIVFDVAGATAPKELGRIELVASSRLIAGDELVVALPPPDGLYYPSADLTTSTVEVIELRDGAPRVAGAYRSTSGMLRLLPTGEHVVVESIPNVEVFDMRRPAQPRHAGRWPHWRDLPTGDLRDVGSLHIAVHCGVPPAGVSTLDLTDPLDPLVVAHLPIDDGLCPGALPSAAPLQEVRGAGFVAVTAGTIRAPLIVDARDPTDLRLAGRLEPELYPMIADGSLLYGYEGQTNSLVVFDLSEPTAPVEVARLSLAHHRAPNQGWPLYVDLAVVGTHLLADHSGGTSVIDISNPSSPREQGVLDSFPWPIGVGSSGLVFGTFMPQGGGYHETIELVALDVADIMRPRTVARLSFDAGEAGFVSMADLAVVGDTIYLLDWYQGLRTFKAMEQFVYLPSVGR